MSDLLTLAKIKLALRINHTKLDTEIEETIDAAKAEMKRLGLLDAKIVTTDPLILEAIKAFCKYSLASDDKMREGFFNSWQYQLDCLRKTDAYISVVV